MSLVNLGNVCAHLQNCSRARIGLTSIPYTKLHLNFAYNLYKHGFLSSLQRGSTKGPDVTPVDVTPDNIATRKLWLGLKYRENKPVISSCRLISKPNLRISLDAHDLKKLCSGTSVRLIKPLAPGELILVKSGNEIMDIDDAIAKKVGGEVLCRIR
ncbi:Mrps8 [Kluyveromyces lactis]|uniref:Small ribosomal subunit protein uS8m n=1 Tax=Kluyveromyces lactis (strain ATCC 8585 / CBS 2359 / DSM 70799 / NBRC 1267 / NRRL Y-1140 / WM37) TaxID=284590 RepID=Q6CPX5_KLULA|nr:mitochondrial 37S ribosomal protein MRPS8 [Kluyveromyces lactis]QEU63055.1 Mrps8 [Kluyveromyces lactis]CAG99101.1 KLLA0E01453p [Kluyveromyces lactis]|eukprot:XP_454014.1 mitochondrial 37S ribosomal protein MRPS8 [Kluyveromyces lactis]